MASFLTLGMCAPYIIVNGAASVNGITTNDADLQFGVVDQIYPGCDKVIVGNSIQFQIIGTYTIRYLDADHFVVPVQNILYIEPPLAP